MRKSAVLTTQNIPLEQINRAFGGMVPGEERVFFSNDDVRNGKRNDLRYPADLLKAAPGAASMPDQPLTLKGGFIIML